MQYHNLSRFGRRSSCLFIDIPLIGPLLHDDDRAFYSMHSSRSRLTYGPAGRQQNLQTGIKLLCRRRLPTRLLCKKPRQARRQMLHPTFMHHVHQQLLCYAKHPVFCHLLSMKLSVDP